MASPKLPRSTSTVLFPFASFFRSSREPPIIRVFFKTFGIRTFSGAPRSDVINVVLCRQVCRKSTTARQSILLPQNGSHPRIPLPFRNTTQKRDAQARIPFLCGAGRGIRTPVGFPPNGFQEIDGISHFVPNAPYSLGVFSQKSPFFARFLHFCEKIARKMRENYTHN